MLKQDYKYLIFGIRKLLGITQKELANLISSNRRIIGKYETGTRIPNKYIINSVLRLVKKKNLKLNYVLEYGKNNYEIKSKSKVLNLDYSEELAELIGIIIGDGCIQKDGTVLITFNKENDYDFINRRVKHLIKNLLNYEIHIKFRNGTNTGMAYLYSKSFTEFLEKKCGLYPGKKTVNNIKIPEWCFTDKKYLIAILRGLFDTDGSFALIDNCPVLRLNFSYKCSNLVKDVSTILQYLNLKYVNRKTKYHLGAIISSRKQALEFFKVIGSSNIKHISRFILWTCNNEDTKISIGGISTIASRIIKILKVNPYTIELPFLWRESNKQFKNYIEKDGEYIKYYNMRNDYKWNLIAKDLLKKDKHTAIRVLNINPRSIRSWREGTRKPSIEHIPIVLNLTKMYNLPLEVYKI